MSYKEDETKAEKNSQFENMLKKSQRVPAKLISGLIKSGRRFFHPMASLFFAENNLDFSRFAVIVPVKLSKKSSKRNPLRRKTYEIIRRNYGDFKPGFDCILMFKPGSLKFSSKQIQEIILSLFVKTRIKL